MTAILKFGFQKRKQLRFSEVNYLNYTKKKTILHVATTFSLKQGETRANSVPIPHSLNTPKQQKHASHSIKSILNKTNSNFWPKSKTLNILHHRDLYSGQCFNLEFLKTWKLASAHAQTTWGLKMWNFCIYVST